MSTQTQVLAQYYVREGYYNRVQELCKQENGVNPQVGDPVLHMWKAFAMHCEGSTREAIPLCETLLEGKKDMALPAASALIFFHSKCSVPDRDAIRSLEQRVDMESNSANEAAKVLTAYFHTYAGEPDKAASVLRPMENSGSIAVQCARGWAEFYAGRVAAAATPGKQGANAHLDKCANLFDAATGTGSELVNLEALMGKAKVLEGRRQWQVALECLNKVIVMHDFYLPALIEKAKTLMMTADWDQALEAAGRITAQDPDNIEALRLNVLFLLSRESRCDAAAEKLQVLVRAIERFEPKNHELVLSCAQLFSRLAGRNKAILALTAAMAKKSADACPLQAKFLTELGYQQMLLGELTKAEATFHEAVSRDETDVRALYGIIHCRVQEGNLDDAEEQLEFLNEIQVSVGKSPDLAFLQSLLAWRKRRDVDAALGLLNETLTLHITAFKAAVGYDFFIKLNADFMLDIAREYLQHTIGSTVAEGTKPGGYLQRGIQVLETLTRFVPGLVPAQVLLAKAKVALNEIEVATRILHTCLRLDPANADTYLLLARIYHGKDQPNAALQYLEQGLSHDFSVRNHPLYHLVKAQVLSSAGEYEPAVKVLEAAMELPGVKTVGTDTKVPQNKMVMLSVADRAALLTLLIGLLTKMKRLDAATKVVEHAVAEFAGTSEEVKVLVANSQLAIEKGDVDQALNMLRSMKPDHPQFATAKAAMADIYIKHRKDKKAYARCYKAIVDHAPTVQNYLILGDALVSIQEPADAIKAFNQAMEIDKGKGSPELVQKIGKAMMQTHDYEKAIQYYHEALAKHTQPQVQQDLRADLARLYVRLQRWELAIRELENALNAVPDDSFKSARYKVDTLVQLVKVHRENSDNNPNQAGSVAVPRCSECLRQARDLLNELLSQVRPEDEEMVRQLRQESAELNFMLGEYYETRERNLEYAVGYYGECLRYDDTHEKSILALARIHLNKNELEICEKQLMTLLRVDPANEEASMLMAELMMMLAAQGARSDGGAQEYKDATFYYQALLDKKPCNYTALSKLIFLLRRAGRLKDAPRYLQAAEKACTRAADREAGLRFCKGAYYRWINKPQDALVELNYARRDPDYRAEALTHMIEIYLNPDPNAGLEALEAPSDASNDNLREVDSLIKELSVAQKTARNPRLKVYQCQSLMFTKQKQNVERALNQLMEIYNDKKDYVPALLAMSQGLIIQKQVTKARNQLKRIHDLAKRSYNPEFMDDFERAWLLLAEIYIQSSKYDLASSLCHLAKDHNRSCGKAWEQLGLIYEKEYIYKDAASHYEKAWEFCNESSPAVGYRLAFNYLKAKRYVVAINICHQVLRISENYPKIRKDVLEKARALLRS
uniref:Tetratricopeptide repeat protein 21B n=1 Tax=Zooxanthella nutricula TaxID=1333877 RepID=A0A7S2HRG3_9DINO